MRVIALVQRLLLSLSRNQKLHPVPISFWDNVFHSPTYWDTLFQYGLISKVLQVLGLRPSERYYIASVKTVCL